MTVFVPDESVGEAIADARRDRWWTQGQLAEALGRPQSYVSKIERGQRRLEVLEFIQIAFALGLDPAEFLRRLYDSHERKNGPPAF